MQTDASNKAADIVMQSWSEASIKQYSTYLRMWMELCGKWHISLYDPPKTRVLDYLTCLFERLQKVSHLNHCDSEEWHLPWVPTINIKINERNF